MQWNEQAKTATVHWQMTSHKENTKNHSQLQHAPANFVALLRQWSTSGPRGSIQVVHEGCRAGPRECSDPGPHRLGMVIDRSSHHHFSSGLACPPSLQKDLTNAEGSRI